MNPREGGGEASDGRKSVMREAERDCAIQKPRKRECAHSAINSVFKLLGVTAHSLGISMELLAYSRQKKIRPPESRCPTKQFFMVILKSTAVAGLPLNLGVEVRKV